MNNKEVDFIARRYKKGRFSPDAGWQRLGITPNYIRKRFRIAAAVAATVILSATAAIIYHEYRHDTPQHTVTTMPSVNPLAEVKIIDFENAPLKDVVEKIETVYDVRIENLPENTADYQLSLHYEGTPTDLITVINDILGTQMTVAEK